MICEKYGILQYNDAMYDNIINRAAKQITFRLKDNTAKYKYHIIFSDLEYSCQRISINFDRGSLGWNPRWIRHLDIYFTKFTKPDLYDCFVIGDATWKDDKGNSIGIYCDVICGETKIEPLIIKEGVIERGSIFVASGDENFDYFGAIRHELKHLYDINIKYMSLYNLNKDILKANTVIHNLGITFNEDYLSYNTNELLDFVKRLNADTLCALLLDNVYLMNKSEISSRLTQIYSYINTLTNKNFKNKEDYLNNYYVYSEYKNVNRLLETLKSALPIAQKTAFNNKYGNIMSEIILDKENKNTSVDDIIAYWETKLKYFFAKSHDMLYDKLIKLNAI